MLRLRGRDRLKIDSHLYRKKLIVKSRILNGPETMRAPKLSFGGSLRGIRKSIEARGPVSIKCRRSHALPKNRYFTHTPPVTAARKAPRHELIRPW
jgi:hypothetical protein